MTTYTSLLITEQADGTFTREITQRNLSELPQNEVLIRVSWSALNYKDALSATGHKGITRNFPHTPGIDASGTVVSDSTGKFTEGTQVLVTSYDLGMNTFGGFSEYISVPASWVIALPEGIDLRQAMILGTAGFTAGLALHKMEICGQHPGMGPILVTGATGGVGSMALALLKQAGYESIASTGKPESSEFLTMLGANSIIHRSEVYDDSAKPFLKTRWAGAIDTVGGVTLATVLKACGHNGNVATCGLVEKADFSTTVYPFIIKGNNLLGVESAECPMDVRMEVWNKLAGKWKFEFPAQGTTECNLQELNERYIPLILKGGAKGRIIVRI
ncbi:MAG: acryloyl-CoA reductase [Bacteroidota bacterium]